MRIARQSLVVGSGTVIAVLVLSVLLLLTSILNRDCGAPLSLYVNRELSDAATQTLQNHTKVAQRLLNNVHPGNSTTSAELHYIRALCLQLDGLFEDSAKEYRFVISESDDENIIRRATLGLAMCRLHLSTIWAFQKTFPPGFRDPALGP
jgi:hypothetical protein